jgi:hypothetical protein
MTNVVIIKWGIVPTYLPYILQHTYLPMGVNTHVGAKNHVQ